MIAGDDIFRGSTESPDETRRRLELAQQAKLSTTAFATPWRALITQPKGASSATTARTPYTTTTPTTTTTTPTTTTPSPKTGPTPTTRESATRAPDEDDAGPSPMLIAAVGAVLIIGLALAWPSSRKWRR